MPDGRVDVDVDAEKRHHARMDANAIREQEAFESEVRSLEGRRITGVDYWDSRYFGTTESHRWDYGDWHHAVMGVQLMTDAGPRTVIWTDRFFTFGVEVFSDPI